MSVARFIVGDSLSVLHTLPDASVDLVLTSPPFLALRSYLPADHPDKDKEMGSEATPGEFIDALLGIIEECARVLTAHGSIVIELGDTYAGNGGSGGDCAEGGLRDGQAAFQGAGSRSGWHRLGQRADQTDQPPNYRKSGTVATNDRRNGGKGWPMDKSLCLIPELFRIALVYGFNALTGRETPRWRARNVVRWVRPNPPVGALGDKFRPATSEMVVACKSRKRYFDLDAVRMEPISTYALHPTDVNGKRSKSNGVNGNGAWSTIIASNPAGAPPLDWWSIPPGGYRGSHYAVFPPALLDKPILAMCPQRVCVTCGIPSERITSAPIYVQSRNGNEPAVLHMSEGRRVAEGANQWTTPDQGDQSVTRHVETTGWTDCGHENWRSGVVLDPFVGSGTTLEVAIRHGRDAIGIDIDERNADLARERVGMFLSVDAVVPA